MTAVSRFDDRRVEVIANGPPSWNGAQFAVDTTIVSPLTPLGRPVPSATRPDRKEAASFLRRLR